MSNGAERVTHLLVRTLDAAGAPSWHVGCPADPGECAERMEGLSKRPEEVTCEACRARTVAESMRQLGARPDLGPELCRIPKGGAFLREVRIAPGRATSPAVSSVHLGIKDATALIGEVAFDGSAAAVTLPLNLYLEEDAVIYVTFSPPAAGKDAIVEVMTTK